MRPQLSARGTTGLRAGLLLLLLCGVSSAQMNYATVTGIVTDALGAVVPEAAITIRNVDTNIARNVRTSQTGDFTVTNLVPGPYELKAEMEGFRTFVKTGIVLEIGQTIRSDVQLEIGSTTESISVVAEVAALNTESGTIKGDVIVSEEIQDLPLEGRDFTDLAFLVPGVVPKAEGGQGSNLNVNGARADSTNFYVDGFNNRNARGAAAQVRPNLNAMQEFKMEVSGYSAEYGRMAGGIMNMVLRSGTNQFHGDLFEYVRNNILDSRSFFDRDRLKLNRHNFGGTLHGPVVIPKLYSGRSRTFFMFSWESYRQLVGITGLARLPSLLERAGNFTQSVDQVGRVVAAKDPLNANKAFPGNLIPASRFHPLSVKLLDYYPLPNRDNPNYNFLAVTNDKDEWDSPIIKVDHRFNENNTIAYRYQWRSTRNSNPFNGGNTGLFGQKVDENRALMGLDYTHLFTPSFLVEVGGGFSRADQHANCIWGGRDMAKELGFVGSTNDPKLVGFPRVTLLDYEEIGGGANFPVEFFVTDIQGRFKFTWVKARHTMKWGVEVSRVRYNQPYYNDNRGTYKFQNRWSGQTMGDFLLGMMQSATRQTGYQLNYMRASSAGMFFNDDFKLRPNLTLNLGVRYELDYPPTDRYDSIGNFMSAHGQTVIPTRNAVKDLDALLELTKMQGRIGFADELGYPRSLVYNDYTNIAPRIGFAWRPANTQKMVIRGGYGLFYTGHLLNPIRNNLQNQFPFIFSETYSRNANYPERVTFSNPFPQEIRTLGGITNGNGYEVRPSTGYLQSYNLTIEREIGAGMVTEIGFVGSKGTHLGRIGDINVPRRSIESFYANIAAVDLRPFSFINGAINTYSFGVNSIYNAGQISIRKRSRGGTFYRLNYAFSKSIDGASQISGQSNGGYAGFQDPDNHKLERGRSDFDIRHLVTASFSWQLPMGRGRRFLASANRFGQAIVGGWQLSSTASFSSGQPFTLTAADIDANLGEYNRPNRLETGMPEERTGRRGVDYPWYDPSAFEKVPRCDSATRTCEASPNGFQPFVPGNSGRNILDGPGSAYLNLSLMKNFRFGERKNLRFRLDSYNIMNHPNFRLTGDEFKQFNRNTAGILSLVSNTGRGGPRVFQASLQYSF